MINEVHPRKFDVYSSVEEWPSNIGFVPYVGSNYEDGVDGFRVLLMAESHYLGKSAEEKLLNGELNKRAFTRFIFDGCAAPEANRTWGRFYRRLDAVVARSATPSDRAAAKGWRHVAFSNFVQDFAASGPNQMRPNADQWKQARATFPILLQCLRPDVVLIVGKSAWEQTPNLGHRVDRIELKTSSTSRDVWKMPYGDGSALVSWVYHPTARSNADKPETYVEVIDSLLKLAEEAGPE